MKKIFNIVIPILVLIIVCFITIGYSALVSNISITDIVAHIRPDANTRITAVTTNSAYISNLDYGMQEISASANIPSGSSVTFQVTITTFGNVKKALLI